MVGRTRTREKPESDKRDRAALHCNSCANTVMNAATVAREKAMFATHMFATRAHSHVCGGGHHIRIAQAKRHRHVRSAEKDKQRGRQRKDGNRDDTRGEKREWKRERKKKMEERERERKVNWHSHGASAHTYDAIMCRLVSGGCKDREPIR